MDENSKDYQSTMDRTQNNNYVSSQSEQIATNTTLSGKQKSVEIGGPKGPEPTRYGDWEKKGRCIDF